MHQIGRWVIDSLIDNTKDTGELYGLGCQHIPFFCHTLEAVKSESGVTLFSKICTLFIVCIYKRTLEIVIIIIDSHAKCTLNADSINTTH